MGYSECTVRIHWGYSELQGVHLGYSVFVMVMEEEEGEVGGGV